MDDARLTPIVDWIAAHPVGAGAVIFAVAMLDALLVIGAVVPAIPIFFAVGTLVGLGSLDGYYAIACAALGAFCGDGLSFAVGRRYGQGLRSMWPFSRHPAWLEKGQALFDRHGVKGILIARYVGAIRPFVPAVAGMLRMPTGSYLPASALAAVTWAALFIVPGWAFGASLESIAAIAGRLAIVILLLATVAGASGWLIYRLYAALAPQAATAIERGLAFSYRHPRWGGYARALIDPHAPESISLAGLAASLIICAAAALSLALWIAGEAGELSVDLALRRALLELRSPLADQMMASLAELASWTALLPAAALLAILLWWRAGALALGHWMAALGFAWAAEKLLAALNLLPPDNTGLSVVAMSTLCGFLAVMLARELPGRHRAWPYVAAGAGVAIALSSQLYLDLRPLSHLMTAMALGLAWAALLGLAFRRHVAPIAGARWLVAAWFGLYAGVFVWHAADSAPGLAQRAAVTPATQKLDAEDWWRRDWSQLPDSRIDVVTLHQWPLNLQFAGSIEVLAARLQAQGFVAEGAAGWTALLTTLDGGRSAEQAPLLPASHLGRAESLRLWAATDDPQRRLVLRLWPSDRVLASSGLRIHQGVISEMEFAEHAYLFRAWTQRGPSDLATNTLLRALADWQQAERKDRKGNSIWLLRAPAAPVDADHTPGSAH